ncbi:16S rRNA (guanine(527)-N(7))-methyltransferase [Snodgrassella alvi]|jgi:16S rRNA (guanine527-N7)-methyltransferase|uniref:Ribosomal RNA small subunit methyltransferase G n=1 Tax=Snodgrassella alvi TaxID=1196083 RepID=A0A2N9XQF3_9NEIS|nr:MULTISPECIES: 16S rRNA (guanine(527)-N(7))-methyltransferase RsmG [Snodgrassella]PIT08808.1 16S rRNA (guanine(527)-N(7))-methyltransferase [Snodgrassella communis]PIT24309.1 16S rRNA (guanine(527)-N(7))-methyltransferase [Snodgrassella communis]PIT24732.1 16S rRNA (guanine(527)-N(7))-methyltransferase [Snodgrassella communis]PIT50558.1 16S rRNA (guanine(527)-N(7))-methyltransferase [Snodgrassella alvi]
MSDMKTMLQQGLQQMNINLTVPQQLQLLAFVELLKKWNSTYNLTALRNDQDVISHHILDSLTLLPYVERARGLIDVGSGGGMPGIPVAIARPDLPVALLDANSKKTSFLQQAVIELGLSNVQVITARVEAMVGEQFDVITSRAFAELNDFVTITKQLMAKDGYWAAMKGVYPYEEIERLPENVELVQVDKLSVPHLDAERHMVLVRKKDHV